MRKGLSSSLKVNGAIPVIGATVFFVISLVVDLAREGEWQLARVVWDAAMLLYFLGQAFDVFAPIDEMWRAYVRESATHLSGVVLLSSFGFLAITSDTTAQLIVATLLTVFGVFMAVVSGRRLGAALRIAKSR